MIECIIYKGRHYCDTEQVLDFLQESAKEKSPEIRAFLQETGRILDRAPKIKTGPPEDYIREASSTL